MMMFMMPMFPFFLLHYPSAFALYWMLFNITSTILQYRMMKASDPDKRIIKSIIGSPLPMFAAPEEDKADKKNAVPPRPKDGVKNNAKKAKLTLSEDSEAFEKSESLNGTLNGSSNGKQNGKSVSAKSVPAESASAESVAEDAVAAGTDKSAVAKNPRRKRRY